MNDIEGAGVLIDRYANLIIANKELQATITKLEADSVHGWRSCIDHIIKPESACPVCKIESQQATIKDLREACWCVIGSIQDEDDRAYLKAALKEQTDE